MIQALLDVYRIDMKYIRDLHNIDDRVLSISPQIGKDERPFLGIIVICNEQKYCVPLSKPKKKHEKMRDKIDFKKIVYRGELIGVLNFNLMIPIEDIVVQKIDTKIRKHDNAERKMNEYKIVDEDGNTVMENEPVEMSVMENDNVTLKIPLNTISEGKYTLIVSKLIGSAKAEQPLVISGTWECEFSF